MMRDAEGYKRKIREYVRTYACAEAAASAVAPGGAEAEDVEEDLSELSAMSEDGPGVDLSDDDEPAGAMEL